ncbi:hypothetical protein K505DRAFT_88895 [Melanomma pulvis-pyrius CBS 109.77]|uniref:Uncharacterized protein n=1 Tax=Melanomma pulvis-pyrius CBS 109.77 TaxID=1314802 RepID=A0A6A6X003_9PLEO|nr:hypothetical protein K505DRAFT_88895 [Melanomma pulvis-pyrius CBS 109.77]
MGEGGLEPWLAVVGNGWTQHNGRMASRQRSEPRDRRCRRRGGLTQLTNAILSPRDVHVLQAPCIARPAPAAWPFTPHSSTCTLLSPRRPTRPGAGPWLVSVWFPPAPPKKPPPAPAHAEHYLPPTY